MLPPQITTPTFLPLKCSGRDRMAATPAAPAPSATTFCCSQSFMTAASISPSSTSTMSPTRRPMISRVIWPGFLTAMPSARVVPPEVGFILCSAWYMEGKSSTSTPQIAIRSFSALAAVATPEMMPPPPIGTTISSRSGWSASISRPIVPCPAMILSSS